MFTSPNTLVKLILDSKALTIWNRKTGPAFWWTSNLPAPFYLRTEVMIGRDLADQLLVKIDDATAEHPTHAARAVELHHFMMDAYHKTPDYKKVIQAMVALAKAEFSNEGFTAISGGERRDWIFSIPFAEECKLKHIYLFKDQSLFCHDAIKAGEKVLHVSDIISKAASYFNQWLPALADAKLTCVGTVSVNAHGTMGTKKLEDAGYKVCPVNRVDLPLFEKSFKDGLIDADTMEEIKIYLTSERDWVQKYIMNNAALTEIKTDDKKVLERMRVFFTNDHWNLREQNQEFYHKMLRGLNE